MAMTDKTWNGSASRWEDAASYCRSCLIDENPAGQEKTKSLCKLPVREPNGDLNKNALGAAAAALAGARGGVGAKPESKKKAARALIRAYHQAKMDIPDSLKRIAGS